MKIGVTGHQELSNYEWVNGEVRHFLQLHTPLIAYSSLAKGADQIFAQAVIDYAGELNVILPMKEYEQKFKQHERDEYRRLLSEATYVFTLPGGETDEESYLLAGKKVVELCDLLIAVWDGESAKGKGGTGDIVEFALRMGRSLLHINPIEQTSQKLMR